MFFYVARQPILDREKSLIGYELLFRDSIENVFPQIDPHEATSRLLAGSHFHLGIDNLTGSVPAFINFPEMSILVKVPELLPNNQVVIELLESIAPSHELKAICQQLKQKGYKIALDDFVMQPHWLPILPYVDMVKIDFRATSIDDIQSTCDQLASFDLELLAEKIETHDEFNFAMTLGFDYFQGYFFSAPEVLKTRALKPNEINLVELLAKLGQESCDFNELDTIIQRDVSLTYKLLRYVNSSFFNRRREINSIRQALVYLGENEIRKFIALLAAANLAEDKPSELIRLSITRARFCELIAQQQAPEYASKAFLLGLFSLISAILDEPMDKVMSKLPLSDEIKLALLKREGPLANYLSLILDYERAVWDGVNALSSTIGVDTGQLPEFYMDAVGWSNSLLEQ
ncbi:MULTISPECIES: EAL and HDOD domain-containing protein [Corallincola]|uniref:HDOD domain-containing protein n=2 Tax=Corallincola TaxID=1775176 RepID=A0A368NHM7_9GAMM|nr:MULTISPECIES: HDOD domain-containing protein [Corallincola]RCU48891.1 HDOD domain-containing protein [Corallincola holothuriorum]TAA43783.1 HDOD domain-containing protein [Corallincola spongiicola]